MKLSDIIVEVRDKDYRRVGQIMPKDLNLKGAVVFNNLGTWQLALPREHALVPYLRAPGHGIVVTGPDGNILLSGPVTTPAYAATPDDTWGTITFTGVTDEIILSDRLAWPQPSNPDVTTQTVGHDDRTGAPETLLHQYVSANIGPDAPAERKHPFLSMGTDGGRGGAAITKQARFPVLGTLLNEICAPTALGFRVRQNTGDDADGIIFETFETRDRSAFIYLSILNDGLAGQKTTISAPSITRAIIGGQGEMEDRTFVYVTNDAAKQAEQDWGRAIEVFIDQRQTSDANADELTTAGNEALAEGGFTAVNIELVPAEDTSMVFGRDWFVGDMVTAETDQGPMLAYVNGYAFTASPDEGFIFGVTLADQLISETRSMESRISSLERNVSSITPATPEWTSLTHAGTSGSIRYAIVDGTCHVNINVSIGALAAGSTMTLVTAANGLPPGARPTISANGPMFTPSTGMGFAVVNTDGSITVRCVSGSMTSAAGQVVLPAGL